MEIHHTIETEEGTLTFQGKLSPEELEFVIKTGLNYLLEQGALPFIKINDPCQLPLNFSDEDH